MSAAAVDLHGIVKAFREGDARHVVLDGVHLHVSAGEFVALLGPSGSGKSTLLNIIAGIDAPDAGDVRVSGVHLGRLSEKQRTLFRRREIGFVFQFFNLIPTLTVEENLQLPLELNGWAADAKLARAWLQQVDLAERGRSWPDRLSGGEQQRVAIARALIHDPRLVLADEPTGNLDAHMGDQVLALLESLVRRRKRTLIVATHSQRVVRRADRVLQLKDGRLVESRVRR
jgi:putative ABC transport system ATP-binding protein